MVRQFLISGELIKSDISGQYFFYSDVQYYSYSGTGYEVWGNCNAPKAITLSAVIYCLRCMVGHDVPLNQVSYFFVFKLEKYFMT